MTDTEKIRAIKAIYSDFTNPCGAERLEMTLTRMDGFRATWDEVVEQMGIALKMLDMIWKAVTDDADP